MSESDQQKSINNSRMMPPPADLSWDPAIVTSGNIATDMGPGEDAQPHWMASLQHLTEETSNHRLPFVQQFPTFNTGTQTSNHRLPSVQQFPILNTGTQTSNHRPFVQQFPTFNTGTQTSNHRLLFVQQFPLLTQVHKRSITNYLLYNSSPLLTQVHKRPITDYLLYSSSPL